MILAKVSVLGFAARSGTGKTTLLRRLLPVLRARNLRVGMIKLSHHRFEIDTPGKDSFELRKAGADQVLLESGYRWALMADKPQFREPVLEEALARLDQRRLDLILVEGFKHAAFPKIELVRTGWETEVMYPEDPNIIAVATDNRSRVSTDLPVLDINDISALGGFITRWMEGRGASTLEEKTPPEADGGAPSLTEDLVRHYRWLRRFGCNDSHSGNASVRDGEHFWVTPTGACADTLAVGDLIACTLAGEPAQGASLDASLHQRVYQLNADARAVLHSHGPYSVAVTLDGEDFTPLDFEGQYYFPKVPVISIPYAEYLDRAAASVAEVLVDYPITVVRGHGVYACAATLNLAYKWTCSLELSAKTAAIARGLGSDAG